MFQLLASSAACSTRCRATGHSLSVDRQTSRSVVRRRPAAPIRSSAASGEMDLHRAVSEPASEKTPPSTAAAAAVAGVTSGRGRAGIGTKLTSRHRPFLYSRSLCSRRHRLAFNAAGPASCISSGRCWGSDLWLTAAVRLLSAELGTLHRLPTPDARYVMLRCCITVFSALVVTRK